MADYKEILDKANSNSNNAFYEEPNFKNAHTALSRIWTDAEHIPEDVRSVNFIDNVYSITVNNEKVNIVEYLDRIELIKLEGSRASFVAEKDLLKNLIPLDFGKNYKVILKDANGEQIPFGLNSWFVDSENGVLNFDKGIPIGFQQPFNISFYRYVGRTAEKSLLRSDGSIPLDDAYYPTQEQGVATKQYVDEVREDVKTLLGNTTPQKPETFEEKDLHLTSNRMFNGNFILSREPYEVAIEGDDITITTDYFYNEEIGQLDIYVGEYNLTINNSLFLSKTLKPGYTSSYWTVEDNRDAYEGIYANYYNIMKVKIVLPSSLLRNYYNDSMPFLSFRLVYTGKKSYSSNPYTVGFEPENPKSSITDVDLIVENKHFRISGVPALMQNNIVKLSANIGNLFRFYTDTFVKVVVPSLNYERNLLPIDGEWEGEAIYEDVNRPYQLGIILPIGENVYTETMPVYIYTYDVLGNQNGLTINNFNVRIDTMERQKRVTSGTGNLPENFGKQYDDNESLNLNYELQQVGGRVKFPQDSYVRNGVRLSDDINEPYLHDQMLEGVEQGPDYTGIADDYRYYTITYELTEYVNAVIIDVEDYKNMLFNKNTHSMINCTLQCKIGDTGWLNCNLPYKGVLTPTEDSDFAMSVAHSENGKYYATFGDIPRKGTLYVRFGTNDRDVSIKSLQIRPV